MEVPFFNSICPSVLKLALLVPVAAIVKSIRPPPTVGETALPVFPGPTLTTAAPGLNWLAGNPAVF